MSKKPDMMSMLIQAEHCPVTQIGWTTYYSS